MSLSFVCFLEYHRCLIRVFTWYDVHYRQKLAPAALHVVGMMEYVAVVVNRVGSVFEDQSILRRRFAGLNRFRHGRPRGYSIVKYVV